MTINLLCIATAKNNRRQLDRLLEIAGDTIALKLHLGNKHADYRVSSLSRINLWKGRRGHMMEGQSFTGSAAPLIGSSDFDTNLTMFVDHLHRDSDTFKYNSHNLRHIQDYVDYYHILADVMARQVVENEISHVLFFNLPHLTYDTMIYQIAKSMGIPTVMVTQSLFPDVYFSMAEPDAYGRFAPDAEAEPYAIDKAEQLDWFYMKGVRQEAGPRGKISRMAVINMLGYLIRKRPLDALNVPYLVRTLRQVQEIYGKLPDWRDPFARFFHENELAYFDHITQYETNPVDLERKFVYFALQLQPELTTSALGGKYCDQALAIEDLARTLPDDVSIYVKENPKQGAFMRGPLFFERLKRIPNVSILPSHANTHALTARSQFVATISGTVGWEAVRQGHKAVVFGRTWFQEFPGVFKFGPDFSYEEVIQSTVNHPRLERTVGSLLAKSHLGVIDRHYTQVVPNYDATTDDNRVAETLLGLLRGDVPFTFS